MEKHKRIIASVLMLFLVLTFFYGCSSNSVRTIALPDYEIVNEVTYDAPVKTQVVQHILAIGEINEENLRALLLHQSDSIMQRRGFEYHNAPTSVYIYIYDTEDRAKAEQGLWLAMLQMSPSDNSEPKITIKKEQIARIGQQPKEKFGLSETIRKKLYKKILEAEHRATDDAMEREPSNINKQLNLEQNLTEKYKDELARKYNLTRNQLSAIGVEGALNRWLGPSL